MQKKSVSTLLILSIAIIFAISLSCSAFAGIPSGFWFNISAVPDSITIKTNETASFNLYIEHSSQQIESFEVYSPNVNWDMKTEPYGIAKVSPTEKAKIWISLRPVYATPGYYYVPIHVRPIGRDILEKEFVAIGLLPLNSIAGEYVPAMGVKPSITESVDPRQEVPLKVTVENKNNRDIKDMTIKLRSNTINKDYTTTLAPLEKKDVEFKILLDPATKPQKDLLETTVTATAGGDSYVFEAKPAAFEIIAYQEIKETTDIAKSFLKTAKTITFKNTGNSNVDKKVTEKSVFFKNWFTSFSIDYSGKENLEDGKYYVWNLKLAVGESATLIITTDYKILLYIIIAIVAILLGYFLLRSPLVIFKSAIIIAAREGGMSEFKVILHVKNRSALHLRNISLLDKLPKIAELIKEVEIGSPKPDKVLRDERKGALLKWTFSDFDPGDERIISYRIASKLSIIGRMKLPVAVAKFSGAGKERTTRSNAPYVGFFEKRTEEEDY